MHPKAMITKVTTIVIGADIKPQIITPKILASSRILVIQSIGCITTHFFWRRLQ